MWTVFLTHNITWFNPVLGLDIVPLAEYVVQGEATFPQ